MAQRKKTLRVPGDEKPPPRAPLESGPVDAPVPVPAVEAWSDGPALGHDTLIDTPGQASAAQEAVSVVGDAAAGERPTYRRRALRHVGELIGGRYELLDVIGAGASGSVYRATDVETEQAVALKLLHDRLHTNPDQVARFMREAQAASAIGHSSIVSVLDAGRDERGALYQVMELLEGQSLFSAIGEWEGISNLDAPDILEIGRQLLGGLGAAHARGIVHRDIKPENIFMVRDPRRALRLKILDFGIARFIDQRDARPTTGTLDGLVLGTPHYMSPEAIAGDLPSERTDLWAAAAVLFHCVMGRPPFDDPTMVGLMTKIVSTRAPRLAKIRPDVPAGLTTAIDRGLEFEPDRRWQSAREFADALSVGGAPIDDLDY